MSGMTQDEAKQKWCPFSDQSGASTNCIASSCAAWRWLRTPEQVHLARRRDPHSTDQPTGYCGLAGKPER